MNIYIYGNQSFKKDIHQTLEHSNIKFKIGSDSLIKDINNLEELKNTIKSNPNDIYLIDDEKIIKKNSLNQKIKFLTPKDGIEEEFLLDNNIADLSVDSLSEIPKYILKKYDQLKNIDNNIHEEIIDIVDEAYENNDDSEEIALDDELANLLSNDYDEDSKEENELELEDKIDKENSEIFNQDINLDKIEELIHDIDSKEIDNKEFSDEEFNSIMNFDEDFGLNNVSFDYDDNDLVDEKVDKIEEENTDNPIDDIEEDFLENLGNEDELKDLFDKIDVEEQKQVEFEEKGKNMSDEFSELDSLNEEDILKALDGFDAQNLTSTTSPKPQVKQEKEIVSVNSSSVDDIAQLISKLLNNKTLEITIKIKD